MFFFKYLVIFSCLLMFKFGSLVWMNEQGMSFGRLPCRVTWPFCWVFLCMSNLKVLFSGTANVPQRAVKLLSAWGLLDFWKLSWERRLRVSAFIMQIYSPNLGFSVRLGSQLNLLSLNSELLLFSLFKVNLQSFVMCWVVLIHVSKFFNLPLWEVGGSVSPPLESELAFSDLLVTMHHWWHSEKAR